MIKKASLIKTIKRKISMEKWMYFKMKDGTYEYELRYWSLPSQIAFTAGMQYALHILENHNTHNDISLPGEDLKSNKLKNLVKLETRMKYVDNDIDELLKSDSIVSGDINNK
jgi:hypothetical protein